MTIARDPAPECPSHPGTTMVLAGEKRFDGHESSDVHGIAVWICPLDAPDSITWPGNFRVKFRKNFSEGG